MNISPRETPLLSGLEDGKNATQTLHEYPTATFASAADNASVESRAFAAVDLTQPSRASNNTQIFTDDLSIGGTEAKVDGVVDAWDFQIDKNLIEHAKDIELAIMAGSRASGSSGTARRMTGIINALTTNASTRNSGASLGETTFNDIMELIWASTNQTATEVYCGATLKRDISGFSGDATKNVDADDKRLVRSVDVYESDFGLSKIFLHRNVPSGSNAKMLVAINPKYVRKSYLRPTNVEDMGRDGDRERKEIITEMTIEHRGEATGAAIGGFTS